MRSSCHQPGLPCHACWCCARAADASALHATCRRVRLATCRVLSRSRRWQSTRSSSWAASTSGERCKALRAAHVFLQAWQRRVLPAAVCAWAQRHGTSSFERACVHSQSRRSTRAPGAPRMCMPTACRLWLAGSTTLAPTPTSMARCWRVMMTTWRQLSTPTSWA